MSLLRLHSWPRAILHIDGDAFFASCEQALHPEYRGKPVICGKERGIVAAASYEAKAKGITRGVSLRDVKKLCPDAIIVPSDYESYSMFSHQMFGVMKRFTPLVEEYSIDEGFCDITGFRRVYHKSYEAIALEMKGAIESELGITVSVGLSLSKGLAKIGSKYNKPSGFTPIPGHRIHEFLQNLPIIKIWGVGERTAAYCEALGIYTALQFVKKDEEFIKKHFTKPHQEIWLELNGHAVNAISTEEKSTYASISKTRTFTPASNNREYVLAQLFKNVENACIKARRYKLVAKRIGIYLRTKDFDDRSVEVILTRASAFPGDLSPIVQLMFKKIFKPGLFYRATGVFLSDLQSQDTMQLTLFESPIKIQKLQSLYNAVDELAAKMGKHTVHLGMSTPAHNQKQHEADRGALPERKLHRLKGENERKHLNIPFFS